MKYLIKEKFWSGDLHVLNRKAEKVFLVKLRVLESGEDLSFQDMQGNELAFVRHEASQRGAYKIYRSGDLFAELTQTESWSKRWFTLDVPGPDDYQIRRSLWRDRYRFIRGGRRVATVARAFWAWTETFVVKIATGEDDVLILCAVAILDQAFHNMQYKEDLLRAYRPLGARNFRWQ